MTDLDSGRTEAVLPGVSMSESDIAPDGEHVAFAALDAEGNSHVWVAPLDRRTPPKQLTSSVAQEPYFGPGGEIYFVAREGGQEFVYNVGPDEAVPRKLNPEPVALLKRYFAPWRLVAFGFFADYSRAQPKGGPPIRICSFL